MHTKRTMALALAAILAVMALHPGRRPVGERAAPRSRPPRRRRPARNPRRRPPPRRRRRSPWIRPKPSSRTSKPTPRSASGRSSCRRPSTGTSRKRSPASKPRTPASRSTGKTIRAPSRKTSTTRSPPATHQTSSTCRSVRAGSRTTPPGRPPGPRRERSPGSQGHLLRGSLEVAAGGRQELPVPVVPGHRRRADQQAHLRRGRRPGRRRFPEDHRMACRPSARPSWTRPGRCATSASRSTTCSRR